MSRAKLLLDVIDDIRSLSNSLQCLADSMASDNSADEKIIPKAEKSEPVTPRVISLEEVRAVLAEKSRAGKTAEVKELLKNHGADRLSDVDPSEYAALLSETEAL